MLPILIYLRYLAVLAQVLAVILFSARFGPGIPLVPFLAISAGLLAFNIGTHLWSRHGEPTPRVLASQLVVDMLALTALLYHAGGPTNPFVSLYLVPVALAAIALDVRPMVGLTVLAAALYALLMRYHIPLPHVHGRDFELHVTGMWINFLFSAAIMAAALSRLMLTLREQRARLAEARERALRDESLLALGSLAAGTAHQLNTPLTTASLLVEEWAKGVPPDPSDICVMQLQIAFCRDHLRSLVEMARQSTSTETVLEPARGFLSRSLDQWRLLRPGVEVRIDLGAADGLIRADPTLSQALINLINNAADANVATASQAPLEIDAQRRADRLTIRILDRGPGPQRHGAGPPRPGARSAGLGIGLLISNASIERNGGHVRQRAREGGGCVTEVDLPLAESAP